jgi:hypothetical protein
MQDADLTAEEYLQQAEHVAARLLQQGFDSVRLKTPPGTSATHYVSFSHLRCLATYLCEFSIV